MPTAQHVRWFKQEFGAAIAAGVAGTPFDVDLLTAIACQETGHIWATLRTTGLPTARILALCVGDTIDWNPTTRTGRRAFPRTKAALLAVPRGDEMFAIAREALLEMAQYVAGFAAVARNPDKFCHGFGIFQLDLQFFERTPAFFLERQWYDVDVCVRRAVGELRAAMGRIGWTSRTSLTDAEMAAVAIAYNTGGYDPRKGLLQGHRVDGRYYGQHVADFLRLARTVPTGDAAPVIAPVPPGRAPVVAPTPVVAAGALYEVTVETSPLRVRREPKIPKDKTANVIGQLPDGHVVQAVDGAPVNGFLAIETSLNGAHLRGFAATRYLVPAGADVAAVAVPRPAVGTPSAGIVAAHLPRRNGRVTRRRDVASAYALNEAGAPGRTGTTPEALRVELAAIVEWLAVDTATHRRYQPRDGATFCNVYAHDYCHLAGVYLPRVWWNGAAIEQLAQGRSVAPRYGATVDELRANDLFRWLRDFGLRFGWRQTSTLTTLQNEVNLGAIGLIVARRVIEGRSGHIVAVVPESEAHRARRDADGSVTAPLQSQAGAVNFRYGTGRPRWWMNERMFAESAFWLHA